MVAAKEAENKLRAWADGGALAIHGRHGHGLLGALHALQCAARTACTARTAPTAPTARLGPFKGKNMFGFSYPVKNAAEVAKDMLGIQETQDIDRYWERW